MSREPQLELRILGPLEARVGGREISLGGARQRTVLAVLLLRPGEVVSVDRLIEDVWAEKPPPSAVHTLEAYLSRLRQALSPYGASLERRGDGYRLDLGGAHLDSKSFEQRLEDAAAAAAAGDAPRSEDLIREALALWRGDVLVDVPLPSRAADVESLSELRLRALEQRIEFDLADGHHAELAGELRSLVDAHPYRGRFVAQLMVALYRSGRQAEALEVYEHTRRALSDDLGLEPSRELQQLSGQIVRQEQHLTLPSVVEPVQGPSPPAARRRSRRVVVLFVALAAAALTVLGLGWAGSVVRSSGEAASPRVALVLPRPPTAGREDTYVTPFVDGLLRAKREYGLVIQTFVSDELRPTPAELRELTRNLQAGHFDLILFAGSGRSAGHVLAKAAMLPDSRIVLIDYFLAADQVEGRSNVTAVRFAGDQAGYLAGYLSGLMERKRPGGAPRVSAIGGFPLPSVVSLIDGFKRGVKRALPGVRVEVEYSKDFVDQPICERIANSQIDRGSKVVFAPAGTCGLGALAAAGIRGVWGVGADADRSGLGDQILVSTVARFDRAVDLVVRWYTEGTLPGGTEVVLGLDDEAVGVTGISPDVPVDVRRKVAMVAAALQRDEAIPSP